MPVDSSLSDFSSLTGPWAGILVGNGASRAVSSGFGYSSLFLLAQSGPLANPLSSASSAIFTALSTTNFEQVLSSLVTAGVINQIVGLDNSNVDLAYQNIRAALIQAVHAVHIPWMNVPTTTLESIRAALRAYKFVYSTNYDLLLYWSIMQDPSGFVDFFFGSTFDVTNTEIWDSSTTRVLYVHGGLHLNKTRIGTVKRSAGFGGNILDAFGSPLPEEPSPIPLFVSEGTSSSKLTSVKSNDYLSFAYQQLVEHEGSLVIFGQSLDPTYDQHLVNAIRGRRWRRLAISIYRGSKTDAEITNEKTVWFVRFDGLGFSIDFFDSTTHPLGNPAFYVP